jgi:uncharacterized protein (TIRG00374 family)
LWTTPLKDPSWDSGTISQRVGGRRKSTIWNVIVLAAGVLGLAILLTKFGRTGTREVIATTGRWFAVIALIDLASVACDSLAIYGFLRPLVERVRFTRIFGAQASGLAINRLTPGNSLGEPTKVTLLVRHVPQDAAVSAIVMFNVTTILVGIAFIVIGVPITVLLLDLPPYVRLVVWIATAALVVVAVALVLIVRRGAVATLIDGIAGLRIISRTRAGQWRSRIAAIDAHVKKLGTARASGVLRGLAGVLASRILNSIGTVTLLYAAHLPVTAPLVIAVLSVGILITWMSNVIPLGLGLADTGNYALYAALGVRASAGLDFTMVNRARTIVLAGLGLSIMAIVQLVDRAQSRRPE